MSGRESSSDVEEWFDRINRQLEEPLRRWGESATPWMPAGGRAEIDVVDRDDEFVVTMDLPGFTSDSVTATLTDNTLFVDAEREDVEEREGRDGDDYIRMERSHESVSRRVRLPEPVDATDVSARMNNGVLTITLRKAEPRTEGTSIDVE